MKQLFILLGLTTATSFAQAPVYLNLGSHVETSDSSQYGIYYISQVADYNAAKTTILEIIDSVQANGATYNMMLESNFIRACLLHDAAASSTNDLIEWADSLSYVEVDPHNHYNTSLGNPNFNPYNYTDLNYLLNQCGLSDRNNLGGFLYKNFSVAPCPTVSEDWTQFEVPVQGHTFTLEYWNPRMLWGGGSPNHCDDAHTLGMWKPTDATSTGFFQHDSTNYLVCNGSSCGDGYVIADTTHIMDVVAAVETIINYAQTYGDPNDFYTLTVMFNFRNLQAPNLVDSISAFLRAMKPHVNNGSVIWQTLSQKYDTWYTNHNNGESFVQHCYNMGVGIDPNNISEMVKVYPNPAANYVLIELPEGLQGGTYQWIDLNGKIKISQNINNSMLSTESLNNGLYFLKIEVDGNVALKKIMIEH